MPIELVKSSYFILLFLNYFGGGSSFAKMGLLDTLFLFIDYCNGL